MLLTDWQFLIRSWVFCVAALLAINASAQYTPDDTAYWRGLALESTDQPIRLNALWNLSDIFRNQGKLREALRVLDSAQRESQSETELTLTALRRAGITLGLGMISEAEELLNFVRGRSRFLDPTSRIVFLLEEGNFSVENSRLETAAERFELAASEAASLGNTELEAKARINALQANLENQNLSTLERQLTEINSLVSTLTAGDGQALAALAVGDLFRRAVSEYRSDRELLGLAYNNYELARNVADSSSLRAYAYGFLGALYEDDQRYEEAIRFSAQAAFYAQEANEPEQHYRWEWQIGRIFRAQGQLEESVAAYGRAVSILNSIRSNFVLGSRGTFERLVAPVYTQYADVLMQQSATISPLAQQQATLRQARNQLESLKQSEIEDYFANQCVVNTELDQSPGSFKESYVAVIYPLLLDDRIEVVVEAGGEIQQFTSRINRGLATRTIRALRLALENFGSGNDYLDPAQNLYKWLIEPSLSMLRAQNVETLLIVPGGALRTVPFAAFHSGEQFLIEQFSVATTPAIRLTETSANENATELTLDTPNLLIGGLTEGVQGFSPLPNVAREIDTVSDLVVVGSRIQDSTFQLNTVETELANSSFSIAHFATHGQFRGDYRDSFLLTYDDRLTLDGLQQILAARGDDPLDLLVLSACETAAGDDRAALGLAGVAVQSGARSVVASLWQISDSATTELISAFYRQLQAPDTSKATSLQQAQLSLLNSENWNHPAYWAPFLLIGNWQ